MIHGRDNSRGSGPRPLITALVCLLSGTALSAFAQKADELGGEHYTCFGAQKSGTDSGVAAFSGKYLGQWPGMNPIGEYQPGPYAAEQPLFEISAANAGQYEDRLTAGARALFERHPDHFRMSVFASHRDFAYPAWTCDAARANAQTARMAEDGQGVEGGVGGATAFPFPDNGLEAIWGAKTTFRSWTENAVLDIAAVYADGRVARGRNQLITMSPMNAPDLPVRPSLSETVAAYFYNRYLAPERNKGEVAVGTQPNNFSEHSTQAWQYLPGTRRLRQAPEVGYDYPVPPFGLHTSDEEAGFNGATDRYDWTLIGTRALLIPYHNFGINDPALKISDLTTAGSLNPALLRYELHRVQVVEATLKPGFRHQYAKRRLYIDDDSRQIVWAEHYDGRGELWRVSMILRFYAPESSAFHRGVQVFHDLRSGAYEVNYLVNESGKRAWKINQPVKMSQFAPQAAARGER